MKTRVLLRNTRIILYDDKCNFSDIILSKSFNKEYKNYIA